MNKLPERRVYRQLSGVIISFFSFSSDFLSNIKAFYVKRQGLVADTLAWYITTIQSHERRPTGTHHSLPIGCCQAAYLQELNDDLA